MAIYSKSVLACLLSLGLSVGSLAQDGEDRKPLFGETHIHTAYSFDAYLFNTRATLDDAYNFAKGKPLKHPLGKTYQLKRPLDFMARSFDAKELGIDVPSSLPMTIQERAFTSPIWYDHH